MAEAPKTPQDITAVDALNSTPTPKTEIKKYDWFKSDLSGKNANMADVYHAGYMPDQHVMHDQAKYWADERIRRPFEEKFGDQGEAKFKEVYDTSKKRFEQYRDMHFDISNTTSGVFPGSGRLERKLQSMGIGNISKATPVDSKPVRDMWGAEERYRTASTVVFSPPKHSIRQGAEKNGVLGEDGKLVGLDEYVDANPGTNLVYAANEDGSPATIEGLNYLRPLKYGEQVKTYEEIYSGKHNTYFGFNGIERPDWYSAKFIGKNVFNFAADVLDSGAEMFKTMDNFFQEGDQSGWDKALTEFQNDVNSSLFTATSERGKDKWYSTEGIVDGVSQVALQLFGMMGISKGVAGLGALAKASAGTSAKAASVASRFWMASLASDDFVKQAREIGMTPKEQQAFYGLYMLGMYKIAGLSEMVIDPIKARNLQREIFTQQLAPFKAIKEAGGKVTPNGIFQAVKNSLSSLNGAYKAAIQQPRSALGYASAGLTESAEEISEVMFDKSFKQSLNSLYLPYSSAPFANSNRDVRFNVNWETLPSEIAAAGTLGFAGGLIARKIIKPEVMNTRSILAYGAVEGGYDKLDKELDKMFATDKLLPGGKAIDITGKPIDTASGGTIEDSRSYFVYKALKNEIASARALWDSTGMRSAFKNTEEALAYVNTPDLVKQTSIGQDIADKLAEMTQIRSDETNPNVSVTPEQTKANNERLIVLQKELDDIKAGKYAAHYLTEGLYNIFYRKLSINLEPVEPITFNRYDQLDKSLKASLDKVQEAAQAAPLTLEQVLLQKPVITQEKADDLLAKLNEKYGVTLEEDGTPNLPSGEELGKYQAEKKEIEVLVNGQPLGVVEELTRIANIDGTAGKTFEDLISAEEAKAIDDTQIYDDVENLEKMENSIYERVFQLKALNNVNPEYNILSQKGNIGELRPLTTKEDVAAVAEALADKAGRLASLKEFAKQNRESFYNASMKAWDGQILSRSDKMSKISDIINSLPEYKDLAAQISPLMTTALNESNSDGQEQKLFEIEQTIHEYFAPSKSLALETFWEKFGLNNGAARRDNYDKQGTFMYLKAIVNLSPAQFRDSYLTTLSAMEDKRTPFPEQFHNIHILTSSLMGGYNPLSKFESTQLPNGLVDEATLLNSVFLNGIQGTGKTFMSGLALRTAQILRGGGRAVLFAKENDLRYKNFVEYGKIGVDRDPSVAKGITFTEVMDYLNNPDRMKETSFIVIDEATLFTRDEIYQIDQRLAEINSSTKDENKHVKALFMGDENQLGAMSADGKSTYNITGGNVKVDRTPPTRFSFRTGNQDIVAYLKHLENILYTFRSESRPPMVSFKYDWEKLNGVFVTDDFDKALADFLKKRPGTNKDYVVIASPERIAELRKKHEKTIPDDAFRTPIEAQGKQWKYVLADVDINMNQELSDEQKKLSMNTAISVAGRASEMLIMRNQPVLGAMSGPGESIGKEAAFTEEELTKIRERHINNLQAGGASEVNVQGEPVNRTLQPVAKVTEVVQETSTFDKDVKEKLKKLLNSVIPKAGHKNFLMYSVFTNLIRFNEEGKGEVIGDSPTLQTWKKQLFYPEQFEDTEFNAEETLFELRLETTGLPTGLLNKPGVKPLTGVPLLVVYANLYKDGAKVGEMQVGSISQISAKDIPNAKIVMTPEQSQILLTNIKADLPRAEGATSVASFFEEEKALRAAGEKVDKKSNIPLADFKAKNSYWHFSPRIFHVTTGTSQKTPYLFYSATLSPEEVQKIVELKQASQSILSERLPEQEPGAPVGGKLLTKASLTDLHAQGVYAIALDGGLQVPLDTFMETLYNDKKTTGKIETNHRLDGKPATNLKNHLLRKFGFEEGSDMDASLLSDLEEMKVKGMSDLDKYVRNKVIEYIRPGGKFQPKADPKEKKDKFPKKPGAFVAKKNRGEKGVEKYFHYNPFLASVWEDSLKDTKEGKNAKKFISELNDGIFKFGVFKSSKTAEDSTSPRDVVFGGIEEDSLGEYSVSNLLVPPMPVFQISEDFIKDVIKDNDISSYSLRVNVKYKSAEEEAKTPEDAAAQSTEQPAEVLRKAVNVSKNDVGQSPIILAGEVEGAPIASTLPGLMKKWFGTYPDDVFVEEYARYYRKQIYDTLFHLEEKNPVVITQAALHKTITALKRKYKQQATKINESLGKMDEVKKLLRTNDPNLRLTYYDYVTAHEFDFLLKQFFPGVEVIDGVYRYTTNNYSFNPVAEDKENISHLETGNDMVKIHLFNMPILETNEKGLVYNRMFGNEDYARIVRMMRNNDVTSTEKARAFFKVDKIQTEGDKLKHSFYQRFLSPTATKVNGKEYHSLISVFSDEYSEQVVNNHITAMLSFLATGNEADYTRSIIDGMSSKRTGRATEIEPSRFRMDLESSMKATHQLMHTGETPLKISHHAKTDKKAEYMKIVFPIGGKRTQTWHLNKSRDGYFINLPNGDAIDKNQIGWLLKALGVGEVHKKFYNRVLSRPSLRSSLFQIAKYLSQDNIDQNIFSAAELNEWVDASDFLLDIKQVESAYGHITLDGERQNLLTLSYPYIRTNQRIKELKTSGPGVFANHAFVTNEMSVISFLLKEGFENATTGDIRPNSQMSVGEQLFYDFNELYLGGLAKAKANDLSQIAIFNPVTFSDKGSDGVAQIEADFLMKRGGKPNVGAMRERTLASIIKYYQAIGANVAQTWARVLSENLGINLPVVTNASPVDNMILLSQINAVIDGLSPEERIKLVNTELVRELMYTPTKVGKFVGVGRIKQSLIDNLDPNRVAARLDQDYLKFNTQFDSMFKFPPTNLNASGLTFEEARDSYFWNWNWVSHNFNTFWLGPMEQYKSAQEYYDLTKRASQISTNRQRVVTRSASWKPGDSIVEGRKMGQFSKTIIVADFSVNVPTISGGIKSQKVFDGASFFNIYSKIQMQASYGGDSGFHVGGNLKPISNYVNPLTGVARYDKYASFEITPQMAENGSPFIRKVNEMMMKSVQFPSPITLEGGGVANNLFELDSLGKAAGLNEVQIYDLMVQNDMQDFFVRELTFDSSVKTGASHLNDFGDDMNAFMAHPGVLNTVDRNNAEWGLILDATKDSNDNVARIASQFVSTFLQSIHTVEQAKNIMGAIARIGAIARGKINPDNDEQIIGSLRNAVNSREEVGSINQIVNRVNIPWSNQQLLHSLHSNIAALLSDETIRFKVFGGQQVLAPASGVWQVVDDPLLGTRLAKAGDYADPNIKTRELKGFNAIKENGESILNHPLWSALNAAVASKNRVAIHQARQNLRQELMSGGWKVESPEIVISPTHFKAFGIPDNTNLEDITVDLFAQIDAMKLHANFDTRLMSEQDLLTYTTATQGNAATPEQLQAMRTPYVNSEIARRRGEGKYDSQLNEFRKTLDIIIGRIPATFFQSLAPVRVVGFAHGADNTAYVHPEILVLQGADHDIDKGNIMSYEANSKGIVNIPNSLVEAGDDVAALKNFIVKSMRDGLHVPATMVESTMPTSTDGIDEVIAKKGLTSSPLEGRHNPISNNEAFVRGQGGKQNTGVHAAGLKTYSSVLYSAIQNKRTYSDYTPQSTSLSRGGQPLQLSGIEGDVEGLIMFSEAIQAAVDNAKDPKLGLLGWNSTNGGMINTLAMFGYSPQQIVEFLNHPDVKSVYDTFKAGREFFAPNQLKYLSLDKNIQAMIDANPASAELKDLQYFVKVAKELRSLVSLLSINREVPNNMLSAHKYINSFKQLTGGMTPYEFISKSPEERATLAADYQVNKTSTLNVFEILNDNAHILSYMTSSSLLNNIMKKSTIYNAINKVAEKMQLWGEAEFGTLVDMVYGLAVDEYLASKKDGRRIVMGGKIFDLSKINGDSNSMSRLDFMRSFPQHFQSLQPSRAETLSSVMRTIMINDNPVLKLDGSFKDYSVEKKAHVKLMMANVDKDLTVPTGDNSISSLLFYYSLIKDKGGISSTALTDIFDYENSEFSIFDDFVQNQFSSAYLTDQGAEEVQKLYQHFSSKWSKGKNPELARFMKENKMFIPFTNNITLNDTIAANPTSAPTSIGFSQPFNTSGQDLGLKITYRSSNKDDKKSIAYIDSEVKKAMSFKTNKNMLTNLAMNLGKKYNVLTAVLSRDEIASRVGQDYADLKGFVREGVVYINSDVASIDTPVHEFTHIWMALLKNDNRPLYNEIQQMSLNHPYAQKIRELYSDLDDDGVAEETFATLTGLHNAGRAFSVANTNFLKEKANVFERFLNWLNNLFLDIFGMKPSVNDSLLSIIDKVGETMLSSGMLGLSGTDKQVLKILGVSMQAVSNPLSAVRDRLRYSGRFEKIC